MLVKGAPGIHRAHRNDTDTDLTKPGHTVKLSNSDFISSYIDFVIIQKMVVLGFPCWSH